MKKRDFKKGFTIIEVVLVLAVAGLIFIMVFVALPALQRSQRDNARRDDLMNFVSQVKKYQTNNRGALPGKSNTISSGGSLNVVWDKENLATVGQDTWRGFYRDYLGERFVDPDGEPYKLVVMNCDKSIDVECTGAGTLLEDLKNKSFSENDYQIMVVLQAKCKDTDAVGSSSPRNLAVIYKMEGSGSYCFNT